MKKIKTILSLTALFLIFHASYSQFKSNEIVSGFIITKTDDTLYGEIDFDFAYEIVQLYPDNRKLLAFSPSMIKNFCILKNQKIIRKYGTYLWEVAEGSDYKRPSIFEIIYEDKFSLLSKEKRISIFNSFGDPVSSFYDPFYMPMYNSYEQIHKIFFITIDNHPTELFDLKYQIPIFFPKHQNQLLTYIKDNNIEIQNESKMINFTNYINSLEFKK